MRHHADPGLPPTPGRKHFHTVLRGSGSGHGTQGPGAPRLTPQLICSITEALSKI